MELWIRSQDKKLLCKIDSLFIGEEIYKRKGKYRIMANNGWLGEYNTLERALEVLDEIQNKLNESNNSYENLVNKLKIFSETPIIKCDNNDNCNISLNIATLKDMIIYEMSKE